MQIALRRFGPAALFLFAFLVTAHSGNACEKCQIPPTGATCVASVVSCCEVLDGSSCEVGPCAGGCGALLHGLRPNSTAKALVPFAGSCDSVAALPQAGSGTERTQRAPAVRFETVILEARR